jgi:hypothetical protein
VNYVVEKLIKIDSVRFFYLLGISRYLLKIMPGKTVIKKTAKASKTASKSSTKSSTSMGIKKSKAVPKANAAGSQKDPLVQKKTPAQLQAIYTRIKAIWDKSYWNRNTNDSMNMLKGCQEYLASGGVFTDSDWNKTIGVLTNDSYSYRGSGINNPDVLKTFVQLYRVCTVPDKFIPNLVAKSKSGDILTEYVRNHNMKIDLKFLVQFDKTIQDSLLTTEGINVEYDQKMLISVMGSSTDASGDEYDSDEDAEGDGDYTISDSVYKMIVDQRKVEVDSNFMKNVASEANQTTLEYITARGGVLDTDVMNRACRSSVDRLKKVRFILENKVQPEQKHFDSLIAATNASYHYRRGKRVRNYYYNNRNKNTEDNTRDCIEELIKVGYDFTYEDLLQCLEESVIIRDIERFNFDFDDKYMVICAEIGCYPYKVDVKPTMAILEAECGKGGNLSMVKKTYAQIKQTPSAKCMENACKHKNNIATIRFLQEKGGTFTVKCLENIADAVGNRTLELVVENFAKQVKEGKIKVSYEQDESGDTKNKATKSAKVSKTKTPESDESSDESENADEESDAPKADDADANQNIEDELDDLEEELIEEGVVVANITHFRPIPADFSLYTKVYEKVPKKMKTALKLNAKNKDMNFMDLIQAIILYCAEQKMLKETSIDIGKADFLKYQDVTTINIDDIQRWVYALVIEEEEEENEDAGETEDGGTGSEGGGDSEEEVVVVTKKTKAKARSRSKSKSKSTSKTVKGPGTGSKSKAPVRKAGAKKATAKKAGAKKAVAKKAVARKTKSKTKTADDVETEDTQLTTDSGSSNRAQPRKRVTNQRVKGTGAKKNVSKAAPKARAAKPKATAKRATKKAAPKRTMVKGKSKNSTGSGAGDDLVLF